MSGEHGLPTSLNDEVMAAGFSGNRLVDRGIQQIVRLTCPQWAAQVGSVFLSQTHI
jgi:hypothetical protein